MHFSYKEKNKLSSCLSLKKYIKRQVETTILILVPSFQTLKQMKSITANNLRKTNAIAFLEISAAARFEKSYTFGYCVFIFLRNNEE